MNFYYARNIGPWLLAFLCCAWPLIVHVILLALARRVKANGWKSLIPGVSKHD